MYAIPIGEIKQITVAAAVAAMPEAVSTQDKSSSSPLAAMIAQQIAARPAGIQTRSRPRVVGWSTQASKVTTPQITQSPTEQADRKEGSKSASATDSNRPAVKGIASQATRISQMDAGSLAWVNIKGNVSSKELKYSYGSGVYIYRSGFLGSGLYL